MPKPLYRRDGYHVVMKTRREFLAVSAAVATTASGCLSSELDGPDVDVEGRLDSWSYPSAEVDVELSPGGRVDGFDTPTDVAFTDDGFYVTERRGTLAFVADSEVVEHHEIPGVDERGESGLLSVETVDESIYLYHTTQLDNRLVEFDPDSGETEALFRGVPAGAENNGGALERGRDGDLWLSTGDGRDPETANDPVSPGGGVLRFDVDSPGDPGIHAKGFRDPRGLAFLPDGTAVVTEHGGGGGDEVDVVYRDGDYGWPATRDPVEHREHGYNLPAVYTGDESPGFSGCSWYTGDVHPELRNRLLVASLDGEALLSVTLLPAGEAPETASASVYSGVDTDPNVDAVVHTLVDGVLGRLRDVVETPDGDVLVLTSNREYAGEGRAFLPPDGSDSVVELV